MQMDREILIHPIHVSQQTATDREETTTVSEGTEDLRETASEDRRAKETVREAALREITVRADVSAREDRRAKETVREAALREITVRADVSAREDHRAKEAVREAVLREITVREDASVREDRRAKETVREAVHRVTDRAVRMETEAKDVTDVSAADRVVRDSVRIPERMMIWYLHRS